MNLGELDFGVFAAARSILDYTPTTIIRSQNGDPYTLAQINQILSDRIVVETTPRGAVTEVAIETPSFSWWIENKLVNNTYDQITFNSDEFVKGFIMMSKHLGIDFRDQTVGMPFKLSGDDLTEYKISGYDVPSIFNDEYRPAYPLIYQTGVNPSNPLNINFI